MKKKTKLIIIISFIIFLLILSTLIIISNIKSNNNDDTSSSITVKNDLSINYLNGQNISSGKKDLIYSFSITNNSSSDKYYKIDITNIKELDTFIYSLDSEDANIHINDQKLLKENILEYNTIKSGETHNYKLKINALNNKKVGKLIVDEYIFETEYFAQTIIKNSTVVDNPQTQIGVEAATTSEGLIQDIDSSGVTYYFRGEALNNYVRFADRMWRIVKINGNNTIKIVLNGTTEELIPYYTDTNDAYFKLSNANIYRYLNTWYDNNLRNYDKYIYTSKICDDSSYTGNDEFIFNSSQRIAVNNNPTFNCMGSTINGKIMLLSADEIIYAGGKIGIVNYSYYLYNKDIYNQSWTITPSRGNIYEYYPYVLSINGAIEDNASGSQSRSVRPVINLAKNLIVTGDGTIENPYEILY